MMFVAKLSPMRAIRKFCLDCCGGQRNEVTHCTDPDCALFEYRLGKRPETVEKEQKEKPKRSFQRTRTP